MPAIDEISVQRVNPASVMFLTSGTDRVVEVYKAAPSGLVFRAADTAESVGLAQRAPALVRN